MRLSAALTVLLESFVAVLVVDLACRGGGEDVVGFGDFDEFLLGGFVASILTNVLALAPTEEERKLGEGVNERVLIRMELLAQMSVCAFNVLLRGGFIQSQDLVVVFCGEDQLDETDGEDHEEGHGSHGGEHGRFGLIYLLVVGVGCCELRSVAAQVGVVFGCSADVVSAWLYFRVFVVMEV